MKYILKKFDCQISTGALTTKSKFGIFSDLNNLWTALSGGAHIVKNEFGET